MSSLSTLSSGNRMRTPCGLQAKSPPTRLRRYGEAGRVRFQRYGRLSGSGGLGWRTAIVSAPDGATLAAAAALARPRADELIAFGQQDALDIGLEPEALNGVVVDVRGPGRARSVDQQPRRPVGTRNPDDPDRFRAAGEDRCCFYNPEHDC